MLVAKFLETEPANTRDVLVAAMQILLINDPCFI
jgi:hypothetical protein